MEAGFQRRNGESLRKQIAFAVTNIQWSYAIFWSPSSSSQNREKELEWGEGYYNGEIKTRKTIIGMEKIEEEDNDDEMGCERSDQLRELYEFLSRSDQSNNIISHAKRPTVALSPEDLTNTEWFYLICMSFVFSNAQGLPGRSLANGKHIWLSNAHCTNTKVFGRALLAKSAGIKTVVCFPFMNGVIELGVTESVKEDVNLIQHVKTSFLEMSTFAQFSSEDMQLDLPQLVTQGENMGLLSPSASSNEFAPIQHYKDQPMIEDLITDAFEAPSWNMIDEEFNNCVHKSISSSDCMSQTFLNHESFPPSPRTEATANDLQDHSNNKNKTLDLNHCEDLHYKNVLSSLLKMSHPLIMGMSFYRLGKASSFTSWKKDQSQGVALERVKKSQKMLKAILIDVPIMHNDHLLDLKNNNKKVESKGEIHEANTNHVLAERRRRERVNKRFSILKSMIPSKTKGDKVSILNDTIAYLKELERKVEELESCQDLVEYEKKNKRKPQDIEERTSDNYGDDMDMNYKNKRKAPVLEEGKKEDTQLISTKDSLVDNMVTVCMVEKNIVIDIKCPWRDNLFLDIIDVINNLHLHSHSIQSSTREGILSLTIKSKLGEFSRSSAGMITQTLQRVLGFR